MEIKDNIKLSVCCICYNHSRYLRKALESVINQKVSFKMEVIIGDDCSTDNSQAIIREYAEKFPHLIKTIFQPVNTKGSRSFKDVYDLAVGKYMIVLETDDFWTDCNKLQKQVDYLDSHDKCIAVAHRCLVVDDDGLPQNIEYPSIKGGKYEYHHFQKGLLPGQTTTIMYKNPKYMENLDLSLWLNPVGGPGDLKKMFCYMTGGDIVTLPYIMSAYRYVTTGGTSFSANIKRNDNNAIEYYKAFQQYARKYDNHSMNMAADIRLLETAIGALRQGSISKLEFQQISDSCKWLPIVYYNAFVNIINRKLRK